MFITIQHKISIAQEMYIGYKPKILKDDTVTYWLSQLHKYITKREKQLVKSGIAEACKICEEEMGGSCCGKGIENIYDQWMLLINILLGCNLPIQRYKPDSCFFLGERGCILKVPHVLCINYICKKLEQEISKKQLFVLRQIEGEMINSVFYLREYLLKILS